jgi:hypothetical protein
LQLEALAKAKSLVAVDKALADLPADLDETYNRALSNIDPRQQTQAICSLKWLAFSMRPLTLSELAETSIIDPETSPALNEDRRYFSPMDVLDFLPSLVVITYSDDSDSYSSSSRSEGSDLIKTGKVGQKPHTIRLAHFSIKEHLVSDRIQASRCSIFSIKEIPANISIAEDCLTYLLQFDRPDSLTPRTLKLPLVGYAAEYWTQHARWAGGGAIAIHRLIMEFFLYKEDAYINWVRLFDPDRRRAKPNITRDLERVAFPLYYASLTGLVESVRQLLAKGANVNAQGGLYGTALLAASVRGHSQIVQQLLKKGAENIPLST